MPSTPSISLDVRNFASSDPGWVNVAASNGQPYSYCYTGGDDSTGGLRMIVGQGRDTAPIHLIADQRYQISTCNFFNDTNNQLTWAGNGNRAGSIVDVNSQVETAKYTIVVTDTGVTPAAPTIACDPTIQNQVPPLD